ncbi:hypothetical protein J2X31_000125 [Flavobacterium arsenatis]|uniref:DUF4239 domain-containing protein n=1 Tax=Flavobacterium arsenatis TaxID=1484332 RepID=A0ABU1TK13_9FLAO|nr:hypothetical protein [Flavobacterium arsenatis]MDR6966132.1 hypothetical protein [Flavobacterium arsenatis]
MEISKILEILIAMGLFYFLFSSLVSVVFEWYSYQTKKRGKFLHETILKLLEDPVNQSYGATLYSHHTIDKLKKGKNSYPQYISSEMFADALIDIIGSQSDRISFDNPFEAMKSEEPFEVKLTENRITDPFARFGEGLKAMNYSPLKNQLRFYYEKAESYSELKSNIKVWFDDYMERVSGWYKMKTRSSLYIISFMVAVGFNLDSITIIKKINSDDEVRKKVMAMAERIVQEELQVNAIDNVKYEALAYPTENQKDFTSNANSNNVESVLEAYKKTELVLRELEQNAIPIGYYGAKSFVNIFSSFSSVFWWLCGIIISTLALSFGAPFWFEVMVKAINVRRSGIKPN